MCNFKIGKTAYSKLQSIATFDNSKNKPSLKQMKQRHTRVSFNKDTIT